MVKDIRKTEQRIGEHEGSINSLQVKIEQKLNIYQIRDDLDRAGSQLVIAPASSVKKIHPFSSRGMNEIPETPDLAQVRP